MVANEKYLRDLDAILNAEEDDSEEDIISSDVVEGNITSDNVPSRKQTLLYLVIDKSLSMSKNGLVDEVKEALKGVQDTISVSLERRNMYIAKTFFGSTIDMRPFKKGEEIEVDYQTDEKKTRLYDAITKSAYELLYEYDEIEQQSKVKGVMLIITDGAENGSQDYSENDVFKVLERLKARNIPVLMAKFEKINAIKFLEKFTYVKSVKFKQEHEFRRNVGFCADHVEF